MVSGTSEQKKGVGCYDWMMSIWENAQNRGNPWHFFSETSGDVGVIYFVFSLILIYVLC